jgi:hypothetical protein
MASRFSLPIVSTLDVNGRVAPGAKLFFYTSGGVSPKAVYSDNALSVPLPNPVIADSAGRFKSIFMSPSDYRVTLTDASGVPLCDTMDPVNGRTGLSVINVSDVVGLNLALGTLSATITSETAARISGDSALATRTTLLETKSTNSETGLTLVGARVTDEQQARINGDTALASRVAAVEASTTGIAAINARISTEEIARANADSALSSSIGTVSSNVGTLSATVSTQATAIANVAGEVDASFSLSTTVDSGSRRLVSGIFNHNTGSTSDMLILADKFAVTDNLGSVQYPFEVSGGVVKIKNALIGANSVSAAQMNNGTGTNISFSSDPPTEWGIFAENISFPVLSPTDNTKLQVECSFPVSFGFYTGGSLVVGLSLYVCIEYKTSTGWVNFPGFNSIAPPYPYPWDQHMLFVNQGTVRIHCLAQANISPGIYTGGVRMKMAAQAIMSSGSATGDFSQGGFSGGYGLMSVTAYKS